MCQLLATHAPYALPGKSPPPSLPFGAIPFLHQPPFLSPTTPWCRLSSLDTNHCTGIIHLNSLVTTRHQNAKGDPRKPSKKLIPPSSPRGTEIGMTSTSQFLLTNQRIPCLILLEGKLLIPGSDEPGERGVSHAAGVGQQGTLRAGNSPDDDDDDDAGQHENRIEVDGGLELISLLKYLWPSPSATQGSHASDSRMHACVPQCVPHE